MPSSKQKLQLLVAFTTLLTLAAAVGCRGFFVNPTLTSITITPPTPQVLTGATQQMTATGTFDDNSTQDLSSLVQWTMLPNGFATISLTGQLMGTNATTSPVTLTGSYKGKSGTTSFTVALANVTAITVSPSSTTTQTGEDFALLALATVSGVSGQQDISGSATWTFFVQGTSTVETGMTKSTVDAQGQHFTVGTLSPTPAPLFLDAVATYPASGGGTITSNTVTVNVTQ